MKVQLFKQLIVEDIIKEMNQFLRDIELKGETITIHNVQQLVLQEVDPKTVSLMNSQPQMKVFFCIILFYSVHSEEINRI